MESLGLIIQRNWTLKMMTTDKWKTQTPVISSLSDCWGMAGEDKQVWFIKSIERDTEIGGVKIKQMFKDLKGG